MKRWKKAAAAVMLALTLAQPVYAAPVITAGQGMAAETGEPQEQQEGTLTEASEEAVWSESQAPEGDQGTVLSPVVTVGAGQAQTVPEEAKESGGQAENQAQTEQETASEEKNQPAARQVDPSRPMVALTFDDGPQPSVGNRIMDCLAQYGGKATFFLVGERVASHRDEVQRMAAEGHEVANHTMNHKYLQKLGAAQIQAQVEQCNDAIQAACGVRPVLMRLPGGNHNAVVTANTHMPMIQWSIDTLDWKTRNADKTVAAVLDHVRDGDVVLMHELYSQTGDAVMRIIPELASRGYQMVTVSELAAARGKSLEAGHLYSEFR